MVSKSQTFTPGSIEWELGSDANEAVYSGVVLYRENVLVKSMTVSM